MNGDVQGARLRTRVWVEKTDKETDPPTVVEEFYEDGQLMAVVRRSPEPARADGELTPGVG